MGFSLQQYLIQYRMTKAEELLKGSRIPVGEVARSVGYENQLHFSRAFKNSYGISPANTGQSTSFFPGELGGEAAAKHRGQKLRCVNQRETIPEGESPKKYAETPVGKEPTGVSFVPFCPFPGLSAFSPRMGQIWVKGLTHSLTQIVLKAKWRKNAIFGLFWSKTPDFLAKIGCQWKDSAKKMHMETTSGGTIRRLS